MKNYQVTSLDRKNEFQCLEQFAENARKNKSTNCKRLWLFTVLALSFLINSASSFGQLISTYAGNGTAGHSGDGGHATAAQLHIPSNVAIDPVTQDLYIADANNNCIRKVDRLTNIITTIAGSGSLTGGYNGDNGPATAADLNAPIGVAVDRWENIYIADAANYRVRKIDHTTGIITTIAGIGLYGTPLTSVSATASPLQGPSSVGVDYSGNVYFVDWSNGMYRIAAVGGAISQIASTTYANIIALTLDNSNNLYFTSNNNGIYKMSGSSTSGPTSAGASLIAGIIGISGFMDGSALASKFNYPAGIATDGSGNIYISDRNNERIRVLNVTSNTVSTFVGNGIASTSYATAGECVPATAAEINIVYSGDNPHETGLTIDNEGNLFICDLVNQVVRMVDVATPSIAGPSTICGTDPITLSGIPPGGTWTSLSSSIATVNPTSGVVSAVSTSGSATIDYTTACAATSSSSTITLNGASSLTITATTTNVCVGSTTSLTGSETGGAWSSSAPAVATVNPTTGLVGGVSAGVATITFTSSGCYATATITVNSTSAAIITGDDVVCPGGTLTLSATIPDGTWNSLATTTATIDPTSGVVEGVASGTAVITYSYSWCSGSGLISTTTTKSITVTATPFSISGTNNICENTSTNLAAGTGGSWSSSNTAVATVGSTSGEVTGVLGSSTVIITYTQSCGGSDLIATFPMTVNGPATIGYPGDGSVCIGSTISLTDITTGGTWSSSATSVATVDPSTGVVTGLNSGTSIITYSKLTCNTFQSVSVVPGALSIDYPSGSICVGSVTTLTASPAGSPVGGATTPWQGPSSSPVGVLTPIDDATATFSAAAAGSFIVTYSADYTSSVCPTPVPLTATLTLNVSPSSGTFSSTTNVICVLTPLHLLVTGDFGDSYIWSSSNTAVATVSTSGLVTGVSSVVGTATISYTRFACGTSATSVFPVTVVPVPDAITGSLSVCETSHTTLSDDISCLDILTWSNLGSDVASVDANLGYVTGDLVGTEIVTYGYGDCFVSAVVTVNPQPDFSFSSGPICSGTTTTMTLTSDMFGSGTWSCGSSGTSITTIDPTVASISFSSTVSGDIWVNYTAPLDVDGCSVSHYIVVTGIPDDIEGTLSICQGASTTLTDGGYFGTWSSGTTTIASVDPISDYPPEIIATALITTATTPTTVNITYSTGCGSDAVATLTIYPTPTITSTVNAVCSNSSISLYANLTGGAWSSSSTDIATIDPVTGILTGIEEGTSTISYVTTSGCSATVIISVNPLPDVSLSPIASVLCSGSPVDFTSFSSTATSYIWAGSDLSSSTVSNPEFSPTVTTTYTLTVTDANGCSNSAIASITVNPLPGSISMGGAMCLGDTRTFTDPDAGGTWSTTPTTFNVITVDDPTSGSIYADNPGTAIVTYMLPITGCYTTAEVTVNALPFLTAIPGVSDRICYSVGGSNTVNIPATEGGLTFTPIPGITATETGTTVTVTGTAPGVYVLNYVDGNTCQNTTTITVDQAPDISTNSGDVNIFCPGASWQPQLIATATQSETVYPAGSLTFTWTPSQLTVPGVYSLSPSPVSSVTTTAGAYTLSTTAVSVYSMSATNIFTVTVTDNFGCAGFSTVNVVVPTGSCDPCSGADPLHPLKDPGGTVAFGTETLASGTILTGNYYSNFNLVTNGSVVFNDATIEINANKNINVGSHSDLTVEGSHLYSCPTGMWNGITLTSTGGSSGTTGSLVLTADASGNSNLIEDAKQAVVFNNPNNPLILPYFLTCDNTIFNSNWAGITINNYSAGLSTVPGSTYYGFKIDNTVFTSRALPVPTGGAYPFEWTTTSNLKSAYPSPDGYTAPYLLESLPGQECHQTSYTTAGIILSDIGNGTYPNYQSLEVGNEAVSQANNELNIFDYQYGGISATNANLVVHNNVFMNMRTLTFSPPAFWALPDYLGKAIYTTMNNATKHQLIVEQIGKNPTANSFYDCKWGVYSNNYYHTKCDNSLIISDLDNSEKSFGDPSTWGYEINTWAYDNVEMNFNTITNITNGISLVSTYAPSYTIGHWFGGHEVYTIVPPWQYAGGVRVDSNLIRASLTGTIADLSIHSNNFAIAVQNAMNLSGMITPSGIVQTDGNTINDTWHGILVNGYLMQQAFTRLNNITMRPNPHSTSMGFGINHTYNKLNGVFSNNVLGSDYTVALTTSSANNDSLRAYYTANCQSPNIVCNSAYDVARGFEFFQQNHVTTWLNNTVQIDAPDPTIRFNRAFVLNGSIIDQQGATGAPINDAWNGGATAWGGATFNWQTEVFNTPPATSSPIYVLPNPILNDPINNDGNITGNGYNQPGAITTTNGPSSDCNQNPAELPLHNPVPAYSRVATAQVPYQEFADARTWIDQYGAWQYIQTDSSIADSSVVIDTFISLAGNSRYAYLTSIEDTIIHGNFGIANAMLSSLPLPLIGNGKYFDTATNVFIADDSSSDYIVSNYALFYTTYMKYINRAMTCTDSSNLVYMANLCPSIYGTVVYQSRALFTAVFSQLRVWNDDSCFSIPASDYCQCKTRGQRSTGSATSDSLGFYSLQQYSLLPNPNSGEFILRQTISDNRPVKIQVWDAIGQSIYSKQANFINSQNTITLNNVLPGMYMIEIIDHSGKAFNIKFIVQ